MLVLVDMGRVSGDYPVPAGYCTTRHYPDAAVYYFKIWPDPENLIIIILSLPIKNGKSKTIRPAQTVLFTSRLHATVLTIDRERSSV